MLKHLSWIRWGMALMAAGSIICLALIVHMLFSRSPQAAYADAVLVMEGLSHALA